MPPARESRHSTAADLTAVSSLNRYRISVCRMPYEIFSPKDFFSYYKLICYIESLIIPDQGATVLGSGVKYWNDSGGNIRSGVLHP